ncbi:uncharacterized protein TM35_000881050 [Trypanosoma theileri]|uniref:Uncharacterized protein n=1 Tax=Trypanosoma theileri TaxID=67003 RepID=A0A1X0NEU7_9TRYP|nr:uncharacterized protein TM35_000881050 [Trypanosoma theileri]ORC82526.1 hypothetical protein TM35_000881050 [Trypanosoma theileri]
MPVALGSTNSPIPRISLSHGLRLFFWSANAHLAAETEPHARIHVDQQSFSFFKVRNRPCHSSGRWNKLRKWAVREEWPQGSIGDEPDLLLRGKPSAADGREAGHANICTAFNGSRGFCYPIWLGPKCNMLSRKIIEIPF